MNKVVASLALAGSLQMVSFSVVAEDFKFVECVVNTSDRICSLAPDNQFYSMDVINSATIAAADLCSSNDSVTFEKIDCVIATAGSIFNQTSQGVRYHTALIAAAKVCK